MVVINLIATVKELMEGQKNGNARTMVETFRFWVAPHVWHRAKKIWHFPRPRS